MIPGADAVERAEGNTYGRDSASVDTARRGRRTWHVQTLLVSGNRENSRSTARSKAAGPHREGDKPYRGKPAVRNLRRDDGNVGIIRSPVRAIVLPDRGRATASGDPVAPGNLRPYRDQPFEAVRAG